MIKIPDTPNWLIFVISIIALVLAAIARDKEWHLIKAFLYVVGILTGAYAAIMIWVGNFMVFI